MGSENLKQRLNLNRNLIQSTNHDVLKNTIDGISTTRNGKRCPKEFTKMLKFFRDDLKVAYNHKIDRFVICHVDKRTHMTRVVCVCEDKGKGMQKRSQYREPNPTDIEWMRKHVMWDLLDKYPDPNDLWHAFDEAQKRKDEKAEESRRDYLRYMVKERKKQWDEAFEKFRSTGSFYDPNDPVNRPKDKKIQLSVPTGFQKSGDLILPTSINDKKE